jgi:hypothetical protein
MRAKPGQNKRLAAQTQGTTMQPRIKTLQKFHNEFAPCRSAGSLGYGQPSVISLPLETMGASAV